jgi:hypothetical protein
MIFIGCKCDSCNDTIFYGFTLSDQLIGKTRLIKWVRQDGWSVGKKNFVPEV